MAGLGHVSIGLGGRILPGLALAQALAGINLLVLTKQAGRSGELGAALVIAFALFRSPTFGKV